MGMGVALFEKDQHAYLAVVDHTSGTATVNNQLKIHAIDECLEAPCTLDSPVWASDVFPSRAPIKTLRHSVDDRATADPSDDEHFLYMGFATTTLSGENAERLYHLRDLQPSPPNDGISELAAGGPTYHDNCSDEDVGYWGWSVGTRLRLGCPRGCCWLCSCPCGARGTILSQGAAMGSACGELRGCCPKPPCSLRRRGS